MNLQYLQYVIEIENQGSISKAAQTLYLSQPYLSKIIRELENEYGIAIFARSKKGITPTESGRLFLDMAKDLLGNVNNFQQVFQERRDSYRLRVSSCTCSHFIDAFIRMVNALPSDSPLRFSYKEASNPEVIDDVYSNRADIGTIIINDGGRRDAGNLLRLRSLECLPLFHSGPCLIARTDHPLLAKSDSLMMEDIYQYNFVIYPNQSSQKMLAIESVYNDAALNLINWNRIHQIIYVQTRAALYNVLTMTDYLGIGAVPILEQEKNYHITSIPFPDGILSEDNRRRGNTFCCIYQKDRELPKAARAYITFLKNNYGEDSSFPGAVNKSEHWKP